ncbi:AfsR/SARP family transcriptional regulator [Candidatus Leptofilum sp.]|uniref:AfsR/SARP family transcriptional regulator n=1 Tax=Candidatus Leptofilum sp. TaxID=3241576 RepID=UPI003B5B11D8
MFIEPDKMVESSAGLKIFLFGSPSFFIDGQPIADTSSNKVEALLAYLVCHPHPHLRDALASLLFNANSRNQANSNLRVLLSRLRRVCEDTVLITRQTVRLNPSYKVWLDTAVFQQTIAQQPETAIELYKGDFLETVQVQDAKRFVEWAALKREEHRLLAIETLLQLIKKYEACGELERAIYFAQQLLSIEPHHEGWHRWLIQLHLQAGQRDEAKKQLQACQQIIQETFGQELSSQSQALLP